MRKLRLQFGYEFVKDGGLDEELGAGGGGLNQMASTTLSTVESRSAESNTITGDLPPSSREIFLPVPAVATLSILPISVDPVKAT